MRDGDSHKVIQSKPIMPKIKRRKQLSMIYYQMIYYQMT